MWGDGVESYLGRRQVVHVQLWRNGRIETNGYPDLCGKAGTILPRLELQGASLQNTDWVIWIEEEHEDGSVTTRQGGFDDLAAAVHRQQAKGIPLTAEAMDEIVERVALRIAEELRRGRIHMEGGWR